MKRVSAEQVSLERDGLYYCDGEPFTGVAFTLFRDGSPRSESTYRDGLRWGEGKGWHKNGRLAAESVFFRDALHGTSREWSPDGQLISEIVCEFGITVHERSWDDDGNLIAEYHLTEGDPDEVRLQQMRAIYAGQ